MKTVILNGSETVSAAAEQIAGRIAQKPDAVLALSTGRTAIKLFGELERLCAAGKLSLANVRVFTVTEFDAAGEQGSRRVIEKCLIGKTDLKAENCVFLSAESCAEYDGLLATAGGIDLAVLGLGDNAHIGYNEPATPFDSKTHLQKLAPATRRQLAESFGGEENVPEQAYTMGIKTIVSARNIMVIALGEEKAEPVFKMLYGRNDSAVPAAFLQIPLNVTIYLDKASAQKL